MARVVAIEADFKKLEEEIIEEDPSSDLEGILNKAVTDLLKASTVYAAAREALDILELGGLPSYCVKSCDIDAASVVVTETINFFKTFKV